MEKDQRSKPRITENTDISIDRILQGPPVPTLLPFVSGKLYTFDKNSQNSIKAIFTPTGNWDEIRSVGPKYENVTTGNVLMFVEHKVAKTPHSTFGHKVQFFYGFLHKGKIVWINQHNAELYFDFEQSKAANG